MNERTAQVLELRRAGLTYGAIAQVLPLTRCAAIGLAWRARHYRAPRDVSAAALRLAEFDSVVRRAIQQ